MGVQSLSNKPNDEATNWKAKPTLMMTSRRDQATRDCVEDEKREGHNLIECLDVLSAPSGAKVKRMLIQGGRTVQALPNETQVTGQDWITNNYNLHRENVIISLPYIGWAKQGAKTHKKIPTSSVTASFLEFSRLGNDKWQRLLSEFVARSAATFGDKHKHTDALATQQDRGREAVKVMRGLGGLLDCLDAPHHVVCPVCVPPGRGDCLCVFVLCFPPSM